VPAAVTPGHRRAEDAIPVARLPRARATPTWAWHGWPPPAFSPPRPGRAVAPHWDPDHLRRILRDYQTHHNQHRPHRSLHGAAPLKPLSEPVNLAHYRVRKHARVDGLINEYRLVA
jgi:hypothetical protein